MKLLVLGGTRFLGRAIVECALAHGHAVTLFHRGRTGPGLFPGVERLHGDRDGDLSALRGRSWDAAIDTCGYLPRLVALATGALRGDVGRYVFVSTISVYAALRAGGASEDAPRRTLADPTVETIDGETYGPLKARCEDVVVRDFGERALVARPGLIAGPHDPTGRFTYWVERVALGGDVLAPPDPGAPLQWIDVRDLAAWLVRAAGEALGGVVHLTGPARPLTFGAFLAECRGILGSDARFHWAPAELLETRGVTPWSDLPLWTGPEPGGLLALDLTRAFATGLELRPTADTIRDTLAWARSAPAATHAASSRPHPGGTLPGLTLKREKALLSALKVAS